MKALDTPRTQWYTKLVDTTRQYVRLPAAVVSVDISGSSSLDDKTLGDRKKTFLLKDVISQIIDNLASRFEGEPLFWAGDGGAILFDLRKKPQGTPNLTGFCFCLRYLAWHGGFAVDTLTHDFLNVSLRKRTENIGRILATAAAAHEQYTTCNTFGASEESAAWAKPFLDESQNQLGVRIVVARCNLFIRPNDKSVTHGDELNFALKYEREITKVNVIAVDSRIGITRQLGPCRDDESHAAITFPREFGGRRSLVLKFKHVPVERSEMVQHYNGTRTAILLEAKNMPAYVGRLYDEKRWWQRRENRQAKLYNISLLTLKNNPEFWVDLVGKGFRFDIILPARYECEGTISDTRVLYDSVVGQGYRKLLIGLSDKAEMFRQFFVGENRCRVFVVDNEVLARRSLGARYSFSAYYLDCPRVPKAGVKAFLVQPYSTPTKEHMWEYRSVLFFATDTRNDHLCRFTAPFDAMVAHLEREGHDPYRIREEVFTNA